MPRPDTTSPNKDHGDQIDEKLNRAKSTLEEAKSEASKKAKSYARKAEDAGRETLETARRNADEQFNAAKGATAEHIDEAEEAALKAGASFSDGSYAKKASEAAAAQINSVSAALRATDLDKIGHEVSQFAKRNPVAFISAAAALGFAAARFAIASEKANDDGTGSNGSAAFSSKSADPDLGYEFPKRAGH